MKILKMSLLIALFVFGITASAFASSAPKSANVSLFVNGSEVVNESAVIEVDEGDTVNLSAVTVKQGSSFEDDWEINGSSVSHTTSLNTSTGNYESGTSLNTSAAGEFDIEYSIVMLAGKSSVTFVGGKKTTVTVVEPTVSVKKITIKVKSVEARYASGSGNLTGYEATADATIELSDGTTDVIEDIEFNYNKHMNDAEVQLEITVDGTAKTFVLEVPFVAPDSDVVFNDPLPEP